VEGDLLFLHERRHATELNTTKSIMSQSYHHTLLLQQHIAGLSIRGTHHHASFTFELIQGRRHSETLVRRDTSRTLLRLSKQRRPVRIRPRASPLRSAYIGRHPVPREYYWASSREFSQRASKMSPGAEPAITSNKTISPFFTKCSFH